MTIRCVTIGKYITAQGALVEILPDGLATINVGQKQVTGRLVGA